MAISQPACLLDYLSDVPDPRSAHGRRHPLRAMLAAVTCAILCGGTRLQADRAVGPRPRDRADPRPGFHPQAAPVGGVSEAPLGAPPDRVRGRVVPLGRGLLRGTARSVEGGRRARTGRPRRQDRPRRHHSTPQGHPPPVREGAAERPDAHPGGGRREDERAPGGLDAAPRDGVEGAGRHRGRPVLPARPVPGRPQARRARFRRRERESARPPATPPRRLRAAT